ncbi:MAG TPA: pyrroline-5-carboxylate reductase dimerization domain-containing protein, partial [Phycisphaerales bacterium]|nr:pyrroline-5-carboxylate reductase dimerization domain-containing protein [Phycisphaerales bacterium]
LFGAVGQTVAVEESLMDAFTALAGSGPAYVFLLVEAMVEAGVRAGFARADSERIVRQTLIGAGALLEAEGAAGGKGRDAAALRESVTSKGGTTEAALRVLEARGVAGAVVDAVLAARDRGRELGA